VFHDQHGCPTAERSNHDETDTVGRSVGFSEGIMSYHPKNNTA